MTPQIKQRIEQIRCGEVPEGYKRTKAGVVPVEWEEVRIGDVLTQRKTLRCISEDAPLLSFTIEEGVIDPADKKSNKRDFLIKDITTKKFALTEVGDIIYNPANLKFGAIHRNNLRRGVVSPIYGIFYGAQNSTFMGYLLHNQRFIDYAKIYTEGTVEKLKTLNSDTFKKLKITLPSLEEQEKIVEILSTQDQVINLIQKKNSELLKLKKSLLNSVIPKSNYIYPKRRFPKFDSEWNRLRVGDYCTIFAGGTPSTTISSYWENGNVNWIQSGAIQDCCIKESDIPIKITKLGLDNSSAKLIRPNTALLAMTGATCGKSGFLTCESSANQSVMAFETELLDSKFLYYTFQRNRDYILTFQSGGAQAGINKESCCGFKFSFPNKKEQEIISKFLSIVDKNINLTRDELGREKQKKKALMQLLLTGVVRV